MYNMPILKVRRVGNSLGLILPKELVDERGIQAEDDVRLELERVPRLDEVLGTLKKYGLTVRQWNELTNRGEEL